MLFNDKLLLEAKETERLMALKDYNRIVDLRILGYGGLLFFSVSGVQDLSSHNVSFKYLILESAGPIPAEYQFQQQALNSTSTVELSLKSKEFTIQITGTAQITSHTATPVQKLSQSILEAYGQDEGSVTPPILFEVNAVATLSIQSIPDNTEEIRELTAKYINETGEQDTCIFHVKTHYRRLDSLLLASRRSDLQRLEDEQAALQLKVNENIGALLLSGDSAKSNKSSVVNSKKNKKRRTVSSGSLASTTSDPTSGTVSRNTSFDLSRTQSSPKTITTRDTNSEFIMGTLRIVGAFCWKYTVLFSRTIVSLPWKAASSAQWSYRFAAHNVFPHRACVMFVGSAVLINRYGHLITV